MKTRRLSEIDLARFAALQAGRPLEQALRAYNAGGGAWSYDPVRYSTADILGASTPLIGALAPVPWSRIQRQIERASNRGAVQSKSNVEVGKVLFDCARRSGWSAVQLPMGRLPIGNGESVRYWSDVVIEIDNQLVVPFFDHRREHGIANPSIRQLVFSMQHLWVRDRMPDLASARLAVLRFPQDGDERSVQLTFHQEADLLSYEELDERVRVVYETWARVSAEKLAQPKKTGTGGGNPFGF